jgi:hypothetical protein
VPQARLWPAHATACSRFGLRPAGLHGWPPRRARATRESSPQARRHSAKWLLSVGRASTRASCYRYQRKMPRLAATAATSAPLATGWGRCVPRTRTRARVRARPAHPSVVPRPYTPRRVAPWLGEAKAGAWHACRHRGKTSGIQANTWWAALGGVCFKTLIGLLDLYGLGVQLGPAGHNRPSRARCCCSGSFLGLLATGPTGPSPLGHFRPSDAFGPS